MICFVVLSTLLNFQTPTSSPLSDANKYLYSLQKYKILLYSVDFSYLCMDNSINAYEKVIRLTIDNGDDHDTEPYECRQLYHPLEAGR